MLRKKSSRMQCIVCLLMLMMMLPLTINAQQGNTQIPALLSTGMPVAETPEKVLPGGAVAYLRANNLQVLLENLDKLTMSFLPEKLMPQDMQPYFAKPHPIIAWLGMQMFGQEVEIANLPELLGIALDQPLSLAIYPMPPDKGFVLSIPVANAVALTGMIQNMLSPENVEKGTIGNIAYYRVTPPRYTLPNDVYLLASEKTVFVCGSLDVAQMMVNSSNVGVLDTDVMMATGIQKYQGRDLTLILSHKFIKPQIPAFKNMAVQMLVPVFQQIRTGVQEIPMKDRVLVDARLRLELGITDLNQLVDYADAYVSGIYSVLLGEIEELLTDVDGLSVAMDVGEKFQNVSLTLFSQGIQTEKFTRPITIAEVKQVLNVLPGEKNTLMVTGQTPESAPSQLMTNILTAIETELQTKGLPMEGFESFKAYYLAKQPHRCLSSQVKWTAETLIPTGTPIDFTKFVTLWELGKYALDQLAAGPFVLPLTLMPTVEAGLIETYFSDQADLVAKNDQLYQDMRTNLPFKQPWFTSSGRFSQEDAGAGLKKLTVENIYTTKRGFFGYQQHELVNRKILFHQTKPGYELLYGAGPDGSPMTELINAEAAPIPGAIAMLLDQLPPETTHLSVIRIADMVGRTLDGLNGIEDLMRRELDAFLAKSQEILDQYGEEQFAAKLLEAKLDVPVLLESVYRDEDGKVFAMLPGGLHYPRPKVMLRLKELFKDFLTAAPNIGGTMAFTAVKAGEFEVSATQSTEAVALLIKSVANNFASEYLMAADGQKRLENLLKHPNDFQEISQEPLFKNPFWEAVGEDWEFPLFTSISKSKEARTKADMRAIGTALGSYQVDYNFYPKYDGSANLQDIPLPPMYYEGAQKDGWGTPFVYVSDSEGSQYLLMSYGKDQAVGSATSSEFDADILYKDGQFIEPYMDQETALNPALVKAVNLNAVEFVRAMARIGADVNVKDEAANEPVLLKAAENDYAEVVRALVENGADVEAKDSNDLTALFLASYMGYTDVVQALLEYGADMTVRNKYGMTALLWTAWRGHLDALNALLERGADIEEKDESGETALIKAAYQGHLEIVNALLEKNADIAVKNTDGADALMYAAMQGQTDIVQRLIEKGADVSAQDSTGQSALLFATANRHAEIVDILKKANAPAVKDDLVETYRQQDTAATMRQIGNALKTLYDENSSAYPTTTVKNTNLKEIEALSSYYDGASEDAWGNAFKYTSDGKTYTLRSYGRDNKLGSGKGKFDDDIVLTDGKVTAPKYLMDK